MRPVTAPTAVPIATVPGTAGDRLAVQARITAAYPAITARKAISPAQAGAHALRLFGGASAARSTAALTTTRLSIAAYPAARNSRAGRPAATGPRARRTAQGKPARITETAITSTLLITTAESPGEPDHALHAVAVAAAANTSGFATRWLRTASRTVNHTPPVSQASRSQPAGISPASVRNPRAQSRCSAGSIGSERRSSANITLVSQSTAPPRPRLRAGSAFGAPAGPGRPIGPRPAPLRQ